MISPLIITTPISIRNGPSRNLYPQRLLDTKLPSMFHSFSSDSSKRTRRLWICSPNVLRQQALRLLLRRLQNRSQTDGDPIIQTEGVFSPLMLNTRQLLRSSSPGIWAGNGDFSL